VLGRPPHRVTLQRIPYDAAAWDAILATRTDALVFHTPGWLAFLSDTQGAEPVLAAVRADGRTVGHFVGAIVQRFSIRILGSPLRGWGTPYMGFLLDDDADRPAAARALLEFAFRDLGCMHVELVDRRLDGERMTGTGFAIETPPTFIVDIGAAEDEILRRMQAKTRQYIRKAAREGLRAEVATDPAFVDEYEAQLRTVFALQGLVPTYGADRVKALVRCLEPGGQVLRLRILNSDGVCLATGISVGFSQDAYSWGAASDRTAATTHATQLLWWEAFRHWHARGAVRFDMGGAGDYKAAYGGVPVVEYRFFRSRLPGLRTARAAYRRLVRLRQRIARAAGRVADR
jgi:CelD/BcsL family acetyltransferase involved in cellulose biosynthesis